MKSNKVTLIIISIFFSFFFMSMFALTNTANASPQMNPSYKANSVKEAEYEIKKQQFDYLIQETRDFKTFIQQEREEHQKFLENIYTTMCWAIGVLITLFIGICSFFGIKSFKNFEQQVENEIKTKAKTIIDAANVEIEDKLATLNTRIESELSYKNANIFVLDKTNNTNINNAMEVLKRKGINHIRIAGDVNTFDNKFCLIVCNLDNGNNDPNEITREAEFLINYMTSNSINIPIVFYTAGRINPEVLASCPYYCIPANNPTTLIMHCFTLLKMFC